jgi:hypothetical protein
MAPLLEDYLSDPVITCENCCGEAMIIVNGGGALLCLNCVVRGGRRECA